MRELSPLTPALWPLGEAQKVLWECHVAVALDLRVLFPDWQVLKGYHLSTLHFLVSSYAVLRGLCTS